MFYRLFTFKIKVQVFLFCHLNHIDDSLTPVNQAKCFYEKTTQEFHGQHIGIVDSFLYLKVHHLYSCFRCDRCVIQIHRGIRWSIWAKEIS